VISSLFLERKIKDTTVAELRRDKHFGMSMKSRKELNLKSRKLIQAKV
jgi:hypothetical protein